ncbi:hypothetical protein C3B44_09335 [Corynebacterium yudongzhengii]|uniref:Single-stranded DNA-binding protein n=1 Tax=Corynebacterium yudongzhengii TaxID=2080740 RepID=A0A2U1T8Z3_9CORY|nr:single-stranded DNA-binding protein [Corynebacterium yudongzhengii]AWB82529.1 hypothetical protein C3B44_09335 [Corynebacterium yudongzhengii]PWC02415.1 single-stranded DNA-binding protein [Corynebacterium yudongzhengii]
MPQHPITLVGNLTSNPKLKRTSNDNLVGEIRLAASRSVRDLQTDTWRDVDNLYITGEMWGQLATNAKASLVKGMSVVVTGRIVTEEWKETIYTDSFGKQADVNRQKIKLKIERLGVDLSKHIVSSLRTDHATHKAHEALDAPEMPKVDELLDEDRGGDIAAQNESAAAAAAAGAEAGEEGGKQPPF